MGSARASAVLRAARWLLPLAVSACYVVWTLLAFAPLTPPALGAGRRESFQVSVREIAGATERRAPVTPAVPRFEEIGHVPPRSPERVATTETASPLPPPPPPKRQDIVDTPPPPERRGGGETPPPPEREQIIDASPPPEPDQEITTTSPLPAKRQPRVGTPPSPPPPQPAVGDRCAGRYIYVQELPSRFNADLLCDCRSLSEWTDMCKHVANAGMGPQLTRTGWYDTNQFTLEVIFHNRMRQYGCLTADASRSAAVYVPYYSGLDVGRHLWGFTNDVRDALAEDLIDWLRSTPAWAAHGGRDHFLVGGRIAWDFRRQDGGDWGSRLLLLEAKNMMALVLESGPWHVGDVGVPYPTYFHPSRAAEVGFWHVRDRVDLGKGGAGERKNRVGDEVSFFSVRE